MSLLNKTLILNINKIYIIYGILLIVLCFISLNISNYNNNSDSGEILTKISYKELPGWESELKIEAKNAFLNSCLIINSGNFKDSSNIIKFDIKSYKDFCIELKHIKNKNQFKTLINFT